MNIDPHPSSIWGRKEGSLFVIEFIIINAEGQSKVLTNDHTIFSTRI